MKKLPTFWYERRLWNRRYRVVVGLDEVGRGAWAGPLVVGAVAFRMPEKLKGYLRGSDLVVRNNVGPINPKDLQDLGIDDSKRLTPRRRDRLDDLIKKNSLVWAVAEIPVNIINRVGIGKATQMGFRRAVAEVRRKLKGSVDYVLIDAFYVSRLVGLPKKNRQLPIVGGDYKSISIAAASIVAKVHRDRLMCELAVRHTKYGWDKNVGYGTKKHIKAIKKFGMTRWHRKKFVETGLRVRSGR
jgi:ribonuclease HII